MVRIIIASNNSNKVKELSYFFPDFKLFSLKDLDLKIDVVEDADSYYGNALKKVEAVQIDDEDSFVLADDSGIEISAYDMKPGIHSARFYQSKDNILEEIVAKCQAANDFKASFVTCLVLKHRGKIYSVTKRVDGLIKMSDSSHGFAYDRIFFLPQLNKTFGEATMEEKNQFSHRALAAKEMNKLIISLVNKINIVLYQPEIPQNTGNIMRSCVALGANLHLIKPLGFELSDRTLKRSGLDYVQNLTYHIYENFTEFIEKNNFPNLYFVSRYGNKRIEQFDFSDKKETIYLVFGSESKGIDYQILADNLDRCIRIPMRASARSLNLSNTVAMCLYYINIEREYCNLSLDEVIKGKDFLIKIKK